jgi:hypothetical protein
VLAGSFLLALLIGPPQTISAQPVTAFPAGSQRPTPTPYDCGLLSAPPLGPPGTVVELTGQCYPLHSGRSAGVYFDDQMIGLVSGETGGDFDNLLRTPADATVGVHELRVVGQGVQSTTPFEVTHARVCVGDCDQNGLVTIDELVTGVAIALQQQPYESCYGFDPNWDATVRVDELLAGIAANLSGCTEAPELFAFTGAYTAAISQAEDFSPGAVQIHPGVIAGTGTPAFFTDVAYWPGIVRANTPERFDAVVAIDGTFVRGDQSTSEVAGEASAVTNGQHWWVSGMLTFAPNTDNREETVYFVMTRRDQ